MADYSKKKYPKLAEKRKEKGLTLQDMANVLKISKQFYWKKEKTGSFKIDEISRILNALDLKFEDIFLS